MLREDIADVLAFPILLRPYIVTLRDYLQVSFVLELPANHQIDLVQLVLRNSNHGDSYVMEFCVFGEETIKFEGFRVPRSRTCGKQYCCS